MIDIKHQITLENKKIDIYSGVDSRYWIIPPEIYSPLNNEFHFDFDPCPYPFERDGIEIEWGASNWVNPPFRARDSINGHGPTAFVRKGIEEAEHGKTSVFILPVQNYVNLLLWGGRNQATWKSQLAGCQNRKENASSFEQCNIYIER